MFSPQTGTCDDNARRLAMHETASRVDEVSGEQANVPHFSDSTCAERTLAVSDLHDTFY
jgi:hypothetical protein